jgi:hypothetical protein
MSMFALKEIIYTKYPRMFAGFEVPGLIFSQVCYIMIYLNTNVTNGFYWFTSAGRC